ncbi:unnamed protein product [Sphacelaria rigidula]
MSTYSALEQSLQVNISAIASSAARPDVADFFSISHTCTGGDIPDPPSLFRSRLTRPCMIYGNVPNRGQKIFTVSTRTLLKVHCAKSVCCRPLYSGRRSPPFGIYGTPAAAVLPYSFAQDTGSRDSDGGGL